MLNIDFLNNQTKFETSEFEIIINKVAEEVLRVHNITKNIEISVVFTDDNEIKSINNEFRNIKASTDVLSFPQYEYITPGDVSDINDEILIIGDVIISLEHAQMQSVEYNHSINREVGYLAAHSILHLLGYDHMNEDDKKLMRDKEELVMKNIKLTRED